MGDRSNTNILSSLSDDDLDKLITNASGAKETNSRFSLDVKDLSDDELDRLITLKKVQAFDAQREQGPLSSIAAKAGDYAQRFSAAPSRSALNAIVDKKGVSGAIEAYKNQFGESAEKAPTGKEIAKKLGASDIPFSVTNPLLYSPPGTEIDVGIGKFQSPLQSGGALDTSPAGVAGLGIDLTADTANLLPLTLQSKALLRGAEGTAKVGGQIASKIIGEAPIAAIGEGYTGAKNVIKGFASSLNPKFASDYNHFVEVATKYGIPEDVLSDSIRFGEHSPITKLKKAKAQSLEGAQLLEEHNAGLGKVREAFDNHMRNVIGGGSQAMDLKQAGEVLESGWNSAVDRLFKEKDVTYSSVLGNAPQTELIESAKTKLLERLEDLHNDAMKRMTGPGASPFEKSQAAMELEVLNSVADTAQSGTYQDVVSQMREIGERAYKKGKPIAGDVPHNMQTYQDLYKSMQESVMDTVRAVAGDEKALQLEANNKAFSDFFNNRAKIKDVILNDKFAPEEVFNRLILGGNSDQITALREILKDQPQVWNQVKTSFIDNLKKLDVDGDFSFKMLGNKLREKQNLIKLQGMFEPSEIQQIQDILYIGEKYGSPIINPSASGELIGLNQPIRTQIARGAEREGMLGYMEKVAEKNRKKGVFDAPQPGGPVSRFSPQMNAQDKTIIGMAGDYAKKLIPGRKDLLNKTLQEVKNKESERMGPFERRFIKKRD